MEFVEYPKTELQKFLENLRIDPLTEACMNHLGVNLHQLTKEPKNDNRIRAAILRSSK